MYFVICDNCCVVFLFICNEVDVDVEDKEGYIVFGWVSEELCFFFIDVVKVMMEDF